MARRTRSGPKRSYKIPVALALVLLLIVIIYYLFTSSGLATSSALNGTSAASSVLNDLNNVSPNTLATVGSGAAGITSPTSTTTATTAAPSPLTLNGKPEVLYIGAEYCPFCAAERWALITALDKFGTFTGLEYMQSASSPEVYPDTSTFTFVNANYTSSYIAFVSYEQKDRNELALQTPTVNATDLMSRYDNAGSIPFIDYGNQYIQVGSQYTPPILRVGQNANGNPYNWTDIASQLSTPTSVFALNIDGAANRIISIICKIDGGSPASVCSQSFASTASFIRSSPSGSSQLLVSDAVLTTQAPPAAAARSAPSRLSSWD